MLAIFVLPLCFLLYLSVTFTVNYFRLPRTFRGPIFASISELWLAWHAITGTLHTAQTELLRKHASKRGPSAVRIGPNLLVTDSPELLRHMSAPKSRWTRSRWHDALALGGRIRNVFAERNEQRHKELRAKLANAYSGKGVDNLESSIDAQILNLAKLLKEEYARPRNMVDLTRVISWFTIDVLSSIAFGRCLGFLSANADKWNYVSSNDQFFPFIQLVQNHAGFEAFFQSSVMQKLLAPRDTDEVGFGRLQRFAKQSITERYHEMKQDGKESRDMLGSFVAHGLSLEECKSESLIQIIAGSDSTSVVLRITLLHIVSSPRIYNVLRKEIDDAVANGLVPSDEEKVISDAAARELPYLQAVIWESLRKTPPLFGLASKVAPPEGERVGDIFFPGGCEVAVCMQALTHREDIFGDDAALFRPERWLEAPDASTRSKYERTTDLLFGSGRFGCLGRNIAWMELGKVFFELMRRFDWQIVDPSRPVKESRAHAIWVQKGMNMIVTERVSAH